VSSHEITQLIHEYGLLVVFLAAGLQAMGFPVPGGTALVVAGIDASTRRGLPLGGVIAAGAVGALVGTTVGFALGRWRVSRSSCAWAGCSGRNPSGSRSSEVNSRSTPLPRCSSPGS
jgi:hypothetical protein